MTGFGAAEGQAGARQVRIEIRTVNHRWFNLAARVPAEFVAIEAEVRELLRKAFDRGHVNLQVRWADDTSASSGIDLDRVARAVAELRDVQSRFGLAGDVTVDQALRHADVIRGRGADDTAVVTLADVLAVLQVAIAECQVARRREGDVLAAEIAGRLAELAAAADRIAELAPQRLLRERDRLAAALRVLLDGRPVDDSRIAQEIAALADRLDITEELVRFRAHIAAAGAALGGDLPVGKSLGFLAQELGREVNTMGSKANDATIAQEVVRMKGELEKVREQLENLA